MIENATAVIYAPTITKNNEGTPIKAWSYKTSTPVSCETLRVDVQPHRLSEVEVLQWGLSNKSADTKKMFFGFSTATIVNNRVFVLSDMTGEPGCYYEIKGTNHWSFHGETLLVPVQGEESWILNPSGTKHVWDDNFTWDDTGIWSEP
jgi:hypothetical protein